MPSTPDTFSNYALSTVAGGNGGQGSALNAGDTTLLLTSGDGAKFPATGPFMLLVGTLTGVYELVKATARTTDTCTIVRGQEGTTALTWAFGTPVQQVATAGNLANLWTAINQGRVFNVQDYGAKPDRTTRTDGAITTGTATLTSASGTFTSADVGKPLTVTGAGTAGVPLVTTISAVTSATQVTLAANAATTVSGASYTYGTDNRAAIQLALTDSKTAGRGCVYAPAGSYGVSGTATCPTDNTIPCALAIAGGTMLMGDGPYASEIYLLAGATDQCNILMNWYGSAIGGNDQHITIRDLSVNGNSINQTAANRHEGLWFSHMRDLTVSHVNVRNIYSQGAGVAKESHCIVAYQSTDVFYEDCVAYRDDGGNTASGIGAGDCEAVRIVGCVSHDLNLGWGITTYDCSGLSVTGCNVYLCGEGLFCEICTDVTLEGVTVGGTAPFQAVAYPWTAAQALGCTANSGVGGISLRGCVNVRASDCTSSNNSGTGNVGFLIQNESSPARNSASVVLTNCHAANNASVGFYANNTLDVTCIGCDAISNGGSGFYVDTITSGWVRFIGCTANSNTGYGYECHGTTSPFVLLRDCQASGNTTNDVLENGAGYKIHGNLAAPTVPATTVAYTCAFATPVNVYITGGTVTAIAINTIATGLTSGMFRLKPSDTITLTYSAAPTWTWFAE